MAVNIAKLLAKNLGKQKALGFGALVLTVVTPGARGAVLTAGNNPTTANYTCKGARATKREGLWQFWQNAQAGTGTSRTAFPTFMILAATLPVGVQPKPGDHITDANGIVFTISADGVTTDQVTAMHVCVCRGPGG